MKAIGFTHSGNSDRLNALEDLELPRPKLSRNDLLVEVAAVAVNPVDIKVRNASSPLQGEWKVLGWDAVGRVVELGADVQDFAVGDHVFYAGSITRPGANSQFHLVDARIAGHKPKNISNAEAAAMPLTTITAWEMLFDRLDVRREVPGAAKAILIIGGAGGVGSIAIQLLRALTDLTIIATASRVETQEWALTLGAHYVIDHSRDLAEEIASLELGAPGFVFSTNNTDHHLKAIETLIAPQGRFGLIDDPAHLSALGFKRKSVSLHWEMMFTRAIFETSDLDDQGKILNVVANLIDAGKIRSTLTQVMSPINAENLERAHALIETNTVKGKIVLEGF